LIRNALIDEALRFIELIEASPSSEVDGRYARLHPEDTIGQCLSHHVSFVRTQISLRVKDVAGCIRKASRFADKIIRTPPLKISEAERWSRFPDTSSFHIFQTQKLHRFRMRASQPQ